jgi:hypothetical protein
VEIGASKNRVVIVETETDFCFNDVTMKKAELAHTCNCGPDDRCWALAFSVLGWPNCLRLCQHPGAAGHESHDSSAHQFSKQEFTALQTLHKAAMAGK